MSAYKPSFLERLLYPYFRRFLEAHEQSTRWTTRRCPACATPVVYEQANFCHICSASLIPPVPASVAPSPVAPEPVPALMPVDLSPVTDSLYKLNTRPLDTFNQARSNGAGIHTAMTQAIDLQKLRKNRGFKS